MSAVFRSLRVLPTPSNFSSSLILLLSYRTRAVGKPNRSLRWSETTLGKSDLFVSKRGRCSGGGSRYADVRCVAPKDGRAVVVPDARYIDHFSFIEDVAAARAPESLNHLLNMLQSRGEALISPAAKEGMIPLVIPLSESPSGKLTSLLRWPTSPPGMEMPVVEVHKHGVWLLAKSVDQYIHRLLVEEDANVENSNKLWDASAEAGQKLYKKGDLLESGIADLDMYLLKKVGLFPDVIERKISRHLEKGDQVSAMITGEFYTKQHFPGFGRPFAFNAQILLKVGRNLEAKDAARGSLKSPWWTLGFKYQDVADIAEWEDEQIEYIKEKISQEGRKEDLKKGKAAEQVALDEAAFLMDLASIDGSWNEVVDRIAECYMEAGLHDIAKFIAFRE